VPHRLRSPYTWWQAGVFQGSNEFHYLTGVARPHAYVLLDGQSGRSTLYLPEPVPGEAAPDGWPERVAPAGRLAADLAARLGHGPRPDLFVPLQPQEGTTGTRDTLLAQAAAIDTSALVDAGVAPRTAKRLRAGRTRPRARNRHLLTAAVATAERRQCAGPGCTSVLAGRRDRRFCSTACRKAAARAASGPVPDDVRTAVEAGSANVCSHCGAVLLGAAAADDSCVACGAGLRGAA
jgi:hypothetical protein